mgnify:CR=1 FL=1|jgi:hypothetical protein
MQSKNLFYLLLIFISITLNACSDLKKTVGLEKDVPNEFLIEKRNPLVFPPDYKILPPNSDKKIDKNNQSNDSLRGILDKNFNKKKQSSISTEGNSNSIENEILKQIK